MQILHTIAREGSGNVINLGAIQHHLTGIQSVQLTAWS
jgi:hypothetical protein